MRVHLWEKIIQQSADPERSGRYLKQLRSGEGSRELAQLDVQQATALVALLSGSVALSEHLCVNPELLSTFSDLSRLKDRRSEQGMRREVNGWLRPALDSKNYPSAFPQIRRFKQAEMLRIAVRDLAGFSNVNELIEEITAVADIALDSVCQTCLLQLSERFGTPYEQGANRVWRPTKFCVLGMGKLGGQELNYSSDVDVLFVYSDEGHVFKSAPHGKEQAGKGLTNHQFFNRLAEAFILEVGRMSSDGALYRIDLRLRPEGKAGPLTRSLASYEIYYTQWGQTWERMMLIKARHVAGDAAVGAEFLEMVQPFRYPRSIGERILKEVAAMKARTEQEIVRSGEIDRNVKLGRGGIREVEFVAQTLQLLHAGRIPFLQSPRTIPALEKLSQYHVMTVDDANELKTAYSFLRNVEHRLQMENNLQTHTIPTERRARERLARLMGCDSLRRFEDERQTHTRNVRRIYEKLLEGDDSVKSSLPSDFENRAAEWLSILENHSFRDPPRAFPLIKKFATGPGYGHVSARTLELAMELVPQFLAHCPVRQSAKKSARISSIAQKQTSPFVLSDPDRVLARVDSFVEAYGARAALYEMWSSNPAVFKLMLLLFDRSEFLAELSIRTPDLVDELALSGRLQRAKSIAETLADLRHGVRDANQKLWIRRYHQAELMRIGLRDILGLAPFEQSIIELSSLADACLHYALEMALRKHKVRGSPVAIIGLGKLGGFELNYGSDLDVLFVVDSRTRQTPLLQKVAVEVLDLLSSQTEMGIAFEIDTRLRPNGEKGLLANTLDAHREYYQRQAMLWEIQTLTRVRAVAGNPDLGSLFQKMAHSLTDFSRAPAVAAFTDNWVAEIHRMRMRIEKERTPSGKHKLALKTGAGGLVDAEFIAQYLALVHGWQEPNTLNGLEKGIAEKALEISDRENLIEPYCRLRRVEGILRRWSFLGETLLPDDGAALYRVAVRCGHADSARFMESIQDSRRRIRSVYERVFRTAQHD